MEGISDKELWEDVKALTAVKFRHCPPTVGLVVRMRDGRPSKYCLEISALNAGL